MAEVRNIQMVRKDKKLYVIIDLDQDFGPSQSGRSNIVASTGSRFVSIPEDPASPFEEAIKLDLSRRPRKDARR